MVYVLPSCRTIFMTAALREELKQWLQAKYDQFSAGKGLAD